MSNMKKTNRGMVREDKDEKLNFLSYITPQVFTRYARHMKIGEIKHGRANWQKGGYPKEEYLESAMRHLLLLADGDKTEDHAAALMFNAIGYMNEDGTL